MRTCTLLISDILTFNFKIQTAKCILHFQENFVPDCHVKININAKFPNIWNIFVQVHPREDPIHYKKLSDFINKFLIGYFVLDVLINYQIHCEQSVKGTVHVFRIQISLTWNWYLGPSNIEYYLYVHSYLSAQLCRWRINTGR